MKTYRKLLATSLAAMAFCGSALATTTNDYPTKPIRIVVGFTPGGATDTIARLVAEKISGPLGQPVIVENRVGASGNIAMAHVARAKPDGYTVHASASPLVVSPALYENLSFDPVSDFAPITVAVRSPNVLFVGKDFPVNTIQELFEYGKANPNALSYAGTSPLFTLAAEVINARTGSNMMRVPYKGAGDAQIDVTQGRVSVMIDTVGNQIGHIRAGSIKPLAVLGKHRHPNLPDVPTLQQAGLDGYEEDGWIGFVTTGGTPEPIVQRLNKEMVAALKSPEIHDKLTEMGFIVEPTTPVQTHEKVKRDIARYVQAAKDANLPKIDAK